MRQREFRTWPKTASVIIPVRNRHRILKECLSAFSRQTLSCERFEILLIDDGSTPAISEAIASTEYPFRLIIERQSQKGPAAARNAGLRAARNDLLVFTNSDMLPHPEFLERHLAAHTSLSAGNIAVLGLIEWSPDQPINDVMYFMTNVSTRQFAYPTLTHGQNVRFDMFYTGNISLKRKFFLLVREQFCTKFEEPFYEDIELGYRLQQQHQLSIIYDSTIVTFHKHPMTFESCYRREYGAGKMRGLIEDLHPKAFAPRERNPRSCPLSSEDRPPLQLGRFFSELQNLLRLVEGNDALVNRLQRLQYAFLESALHYASQSGLETYQAMKRKEGIAA